MPINIHRLDRALSVFGIKDGVIIRNGLNVQSSGFLDVLHAREIGRIGDQKTSGLIQVYKNSTYIHQDLWEIETLLERIAWTRDLWAEDKIEFGLWSRFTALDIALLHVTIRSMMDYAAALLRLISGKPGQLPMSKNDDLETDGQVSFKRLYTCAKKPGSEERFGPAFIRAITDCEWFHLLRSVRDSIVHMGGKPIMMYDKPRILFQILKGSDSEFLVKLPEVMYNPNVVDFELYAGMIYGYLLNFLEDVGALIFDWASASGEDRLARCINNHPGMIAGKCWIEAVRAKAPD
jgi:hypothetical protein